METNFAGWATPAPDEKHPDAPRANLVSTKHQQYQYLVSTYKVLRLEHRLGRHEPSAALTRGLRLPADNGGLGGFHPLALARGREFVH